MKVMLSIATTIVVSMPILALASGLVPCGDPGQPSCQTCHFYVLVENVIEWFTAIATVLVSVIIVYGGLRIATANGNAIAVRTGRKIIGTAIVGFILVLTASILIDFLLTVFANPDRSGNILSSIQCVEQPGTRTIDVETGDGS